MASGLHIYRPDGALQLSSDWDKSLVAGEEITLRANPSPIGDLSTVGIGSGVPGRECHLRELIYSTGADFLCKTNTTYWVRIPSGGSICRIYDRLGGNVGTQDIRVREATNVQLNHRSGYLDVFNSSGGLSWSAASAGDTPNIRGSAQFNRAAVIGQSGGAATTIDGEPYFLINSLSGFAEDDGVVAYTYGVCLFRSGNQYFCFGEYYRSGGGSKIPSEMLPEVIRVPYAYF